MASHKETIKIIDEFIDFCKEYRQKKMENKTTLKDEVKWLELYKKSMVVIVDYDVDQINYRGDKNVKSNSSKDRI